MKKITSILLAMLTAASLATLSLQLKPETNDNKRTKPHHTISQTTQTHSPTLDSKAEIIYDPKTKTTTQTEFIDTEDGTITRITRTYSNGQIEIIEDFENGTTNRICHLKYNSNGELTRNFYEEITRNPRTNDQRYRTTEYDPYGNELEEIIEEYKPDQSVPYFRQRTTSYPTIEKKTETQRKDGTLETRIQRLESNGKEIITTIQYPNGEYQRTSEIYYEGRIREIRIEIGDKYGPTKEIKTKYNPGKKEVTTSSF